MSTPEMLEKVLFCKGKTANTTGQILTVNCDGYLLFSYVYAFIWLFPKQCTYFTYSFSPLKTVLPILFCVSGTKDMSPCSQI